MKRFLIPKAAPAGDSQGAGPDAKRPRPEEGAGGARAATREPSCFLSWNANCLFHRLERAADRAAFERVIEAEQPDIILIQEVKMAAQGPRGAKKGDGKPRSRGELNTNEKSNCSDTGAVQRVLNTSRQLKKYNVSWSLSDWRYAGTALLVKKDIKRPVLRYNILPGAKPNLHHPDGRVILAEWPGYLSLLNTYAPNNGWGPEGFERRKVWDAEVEVFVRESWAAGKPLVWMGDLVRTPRERGCTAVVGVFRACGEVTKPPCRTWPTGGMTCQILSSSRRLWTRSTPSPSPTRLASRGTLPRSSAVLAGFLRQAGWSTPS
mmetsp:Transcript_27549/g.88392  ORF Transcript_27549/g.88392 Transcript_27549/m.88392 type:complete len:320 (-) Transcript_27549:232-1191(-)